MGQASTRRQNHPRPVDVPQRTRRTRGKGTTAGRHRRPPGNQPPLPRTRCRHHRCLRHPLARQRQLPPQLRPPFRRALTPATSCPTSSATCRSRFRATPNSAKMLAKVCNEHGVETLAHDATTLGPEYGTLVPMRYMNADQHFKAISVSALCQSHYLNDSARLGWAMRKAVEDHYDGTVAFFASGSPQPPLCAERPRTPTYAFKIWTPFLETLDRRVVADVGAGRMESLLRNAARVRRQGPRRRLHARHRHDARCALGWSDYDRPGRSHHAVFRRLRHGPDQRRLPRHAADRRKPSPPRRPHRRKGYQTVSRL